MSNAKRHDRKFTRTHYLVGMGFAIALVYGGYYAKARLNIDVLPGEHTPQVLQDWSGGIIQCRWFANPHHCR